MKHSHRLKDEGGRDLGHLRCDFVFEARAKTRPGKPHRFSFREANYELQPGTVRVSLEAFTPFIPLDADESGLPIAVLRYRVSNRGRDAVTASVAFTVSPTKVSRLTGPA